MINKKKLITATLLPKTPAVGVLNILGFSSIISLVIWIEFENTGGFFQFTTSLYKLNLTEFFLAFTAITIITHCSIVAYNKRYNHNLLQFSITSLCILIILLTLILYLHEGSVTIKHFSLEFSFLKDSFGFFSKIFTILASLSCMYLLQNYYIVEHKINNTEYYDLLILYAILGLTMLISANDFTTIFLALELQSLSLYMLSGFKKNSIYSIESSIKYFILGALSAGYFLFGWSLPYWVSSLLCMCVFVNLFSNTDSEKNTLTMTQNSLRPSYNDESRFSTLLLNNEDSPESSLITIITKRFYHEVCNEIVVVPTRTEVLTHLRTFQKKQDLLTCVNQLESLLEYIKKGNFNAEDQGLKEIETALILTIYCVKLGLWLANVIPVIPELPAGTNININRYLWIFLCYMFWMFPNTTLLLFGGNLPVNLINAVLLVESYFKSTADSSSAFAPGQSFPDHMYTKDNDYCVYFSYFVIYMLLALVPERYAYPKGSKVPDYPLEIEKIFAKSSQEQQGKSASDFFTQAVECIVEEQFF